MKIFQSKSGDRAEIGQGDRVKRAIESFSIGSRARYFVDHNDEAQLETLVVGYAIDDVALFQNRELTVADGHLWLVSEQGKELISDFDQFGLIVPSSTGEEKKLDYQTRASLGRRGPFGVGKLITLMSLNPSRENVKLTADVRRNLVVKEGIHSGHTVAILDLDLSSLESFESRTQTRVEINVAVAIKLETSEKFFAAYALDISERGLRVVLDPPDTPASVLKIKSPVEIKMSLAADRPPLVLKGEIIQKRQREFVVELKRIQRRSEFVNFELLDAMELKINLQELSQQHSGLN